MVAPPFATTAAAIVVTPVPSAIWVPLVGRVMDIVGAVVTTVALTAEDVTTAPLLSVARAVSDTVPAAVGVHAKL
jgi:hypothetical protein